LETNAELSKECSAMVPTIEVNNNSPRVERCARTGTLKVHTSTPTLLKRNQRLVFLITSAETHLVTELFGAIPLIQRRDGKNVLQEQNAVQ
jgi:hypothetical protein